MNINLCIQETKILNAYISFTCVCWSTTIANYRLQATSCNHIACTARDSKPNLTVTTDDRQESNCARWWWCRRFPS
uniref:Uncharacterized protein n=1 Tax=Rhizophora mucronata TaxID=61149 RepID=A0A2P2INU4_RHIMU